MKSSRLEGITDGIVAIAATIMVLELDFRAEETFKAFFYDQGPTLIAFFNSFFIIYVMWYNHTREFKKIEEVSPKLVLYNGLWLANVSLIPFATGWVGKHSTAYIPELFYAVVILLCTLLFQLIFHEIRKEFPSERNDDKIVFYNRLPVYIGLIIAIIVAHIKPIFTLFIVFLVAIFMIVQMLKKAIP